MSDALLLDVHPTASPRALRDRPARRRAGIDADRPRIALADQRRVARAAEAAVRAAGCRARHHRGLAGPAHRRARPTSRSSRWGSPESAVRKASRRDLAAAVAQGAAAATTVSATMLLAHLAGIRVFATGGIGGVHPSAGGPTVRRLRRPDRTGANPGRRRLRRSQEHPRPARHAGSAGNAGRARAGLRDR